MHGEHAAAAALVAESLRWIVLLPLLGAIFQMFFGRSAGRRAVHVVACGSVGAAFVVALLAFLRLRSAGAGAVLVDAVYRWIATDGFAADVTFALDALSAVMCLVVTGVGFLIHVYSTGYMAHEPDYARYFAYLNLFTAAMLVLVLADNLVLLFVGWEGVGLCSYLLIGFWYTDPAKASAGKKAFVVNRIGDAGFLLGTLLLFWALSDLGAASVRFADINHYAAELAPNVALTAALLLFIGATGKSAQIPLFVWLPDAMAGPTPVSALIHAATMVTAGIYMIARLNGLYLAAPAAMELVAVIGAATAFGAATTGIAQNDIKKVLAYSTLSQLGYMFLALGVGAFAAAVFHVVTHAFFKALLFLGAGSVIHALHDEQDIRNMGGLRAKLPITYRTFLIATLAIAGVPGLAGFFSKDEILASVYASGHVGLWVVGVVGAGVTAFYMTRLLVLVFFGESRCDHHKWEHAHESPPSMAIPLVILAVLSVVGGYVGVPAVLGGGNAFGHFLAPVVGHHELGLSQGTEIGLMAVSVVIALGGIVLGWTFYARGPAADDAFAERAPVLHRTLAHAYYVDEVYDRRIVASVVVFARALWRGVDVAVIDGLANAVASAAQTLGDSWRRWSTGNVQHYALTLLLGVVLLMGFVAARALG
jgi:NADH-quinone oxidoreductase subunit L